MSGRDGAVTVAHEGASIRLFGAVGCHVDGQPVTLPGGKPALLLAVLALEAGRTVRTADVVDGLWEDDPPASARALVHTYVSALRRSLDVPGGPTVETVPGGYRLSLPAGAVDVHRVLAAAGSDDPDDWRAALEASWAPLVEGAESEHLRGWQRRVDGTRDALRDRLWAADLDAGRASAVVPEVRSALETDPLREDRVLLLARGLASLGRVEEGLRVLDGFTRRLGEELGLDPSPAVPELRQRLVASGPPPAAPDTPPTVPGRAPPDRRVALGIALAVVAVLAVGLGIRAMTDRDEPDAGERAAGDVDAPALMAVDPADGGVRRVADLPVEPTQLEAYQGVVWVRSESDRAVARVAHGQVEVTGLTAPPTSLAVVDGRAVVGLGFTGETVEVTADGQGPPSEAVPGTAGRLTLAAGTDGLWVATITGRLHPPPGTPGWTQPADLGGSPYRLAVDGSRAWAVTTGRAQLVSVTPEAPVRSALRGEAVDVGVADGQAYAVTTGDDRLWRTSPTSGRVVATRILPGRPAAVLATTTAVWVAVTSPPSVTAYDPDTLGVLRVVDLPREPVDLASDGADLVVALR